MSKRKLTLKQQRIAKTRQQQHLSETETTQPEQTGTVIGHYATEYDIQTEAGKIIRCQQRQNLGNIVTGDKIAWQPIDEETGIIIAIKPRRSELTRPGFHGRTKIIAANIDAALIVIAVKPTFASILLDRYLTGVIAANLTPIILLNKTDLQTKQETEQTKQLSQYYTNLGYTTLLTSTQNQTSITQIKNTIGNQTLILIGQSGVGKSSLVHQLIPNIDIRIAEISEKTGLGQHTTSSSQLYKIPNGGNIIDAPGFRDFSVDHLTFQQLIDTYKDFHPYLKHCHFRNCRHTTEPNCAIHQAVNEQKIPQHRYDNYKKILEQLKNP